MKRTLILKSAVATAALFAVLSGSQAQQAAPASAGASAPAAVPDWLKAPVIVTHADYTSTYTEVPLPIGSDNPKATISATAYTVSAAAGSQRPVLFLFNGGPGASSTPLHFGALGPKRFVEKDGERKLEQNSAVPLAKTDLVFIDPVGTGFSQVFEQGKSSYWATETDAKAFVDLIRYWLKANGREGAPVYIAGESYGGYRLATMAKYAADIPNLTGLILISPMLDATLVQPAQGNELAYVAQLPSLVVAAWHHGKGDRSVQGNSLEEVYQRAYDFARDVYAPALLQGSLLSEARAQALAQQLSVRVGLSKEQLLKARLRPTSEEFQAGVLGDPTKRIGRLDARAIGPYVAADVGKPTSDPSLKLSKPPASGPTATERYFREELQVPISRKYNSLNFTITFGWNFLDGSFFDNLYLNATRHLSSALKANTKLRVLYAGGYYDLATTVGSSKYSLEHGDLPMDRVQMKLFAGGHSFYEDDDNRVQFGRAVQDFIK